MRLIDADAFDERVRAAGGMSEDELTEDFKDGVQAVLYLLSNQPTINPEQGGDGMSDKSTPTIKKCPFCGSEVDLMTLFTGVKMFYCRNHSGCGAIVSFDNKKCNYEKGDAEKIKAWNRRVTE